MVNTSRRLNQLCVTTLFGLVWIRAPTIYSITFYYINFSVLADVVEVENKTGNGRNTA